MSTIQTKSLKSRAIRAGFWTIFGHGSGQFIRLATNLVMTRLLVPEMFGVMTIVTVIMIGLVMFSDLGLRQNIIQSKRGDDPVFLNTVWTVQAMIGIGLWLLSVVVAILFYLAGQLEMIPAGTVYSHPLLPWVIPVAVVAVLIKSFEPTWTSTASRRLEQSKITMIEIASQLFSVLVMVVWAMFDRSIWALVAGGVSASMARSFIVWVLIPGPRNRWMIDRESMHEVFHFGKWLFWSSILTFLFFNGDRLLLGGLITTRELGIYTIAFFIVSAVSQGINGLLQNVAFPALSETARNNPQALIHVYYRFRLPLDAGVMLLAGFMFISGSVIIQILYDQRYYEAGMMIEVLSLILIATRYSLTDQCFMAIGKPKIMSALTGLRTIVLFISIPLAFDWFGLTGALWAIVLSYFASFPFTIYAKHRYRLLDIRKELVTLPFFVLGILSGYVLNHIFY